MTAAAASVETADECPRRWTRPYRTGRSSSQLYDRHGAIKRRIRSMLGIKSAKTAYATLKGIEVMRRIRKLQCILLRPGVAAETRFFNQLFGVYA